MPRGTCAECSLSDALGPGLADDEAFLCCDCDIELNAYTSAERADPAGAGRERGRRASGPAVAAAGALEPVDFDPLAGADASAEGARHAGPLELLCDPEQNFFAGVGSKVWPAAAPLARHLAVLCGLGPSLGMPGEAAPAVPPVRRIVEVGAGCGAVGLWLWRACHPRLELCLTDLPRLCPLLEANAGRARSAVEHKPAIGDGAVLVRPLRWGIAEDASAFAGECWDLVVGSDVCYNAEKVEPLMGTVAKLAPRLGAVLALSMDRLRGPGAEALIASCAAEGWTWREFGREQACDGTEVLVAQLAPPPATATTLKGRPL